MSAGSKARRAKPVPITPRVEFTTCETTGKRGFKDRMTALAGFTKAQRRTQVRRLYRCQFCGLWHMTSQRPN